MKTFNLRAFKPSTFATIILVAFAIIAILSAIHGCLPMEPTVTQVPGRYLPAGPEDTAGMAMLVAFVGHHNLQVGDDDMPTKPCTSEGPSGPCTEAYRGVYFCHDVCGNAFWHLSADNVCIDAMTGTVIFCR